MWAAIPTAVVVLAVLTWTRVKVPGPDEAFLITGRRRKSGDTAAPGQRVVLGAAVFVLPVVQRLHHIDLSSRKIRFRIGGSLTATGIRVGVEALAVVKIGGTADAVTAAAQRFLRQQDQIDDFTEQILAGALRSVLGRFTVEQAVHDRAALAAAVSEEATAALAHQGLVLDGFLIEEITADGGYLNDLGRPEAARVAMEAAIAEARARQSSEEERMRAEERIADAERSLALKRAEIQAEIDAAKARSAAAGPLSRAEQDENILKAQQAVAARNAELKERQLDTEIRKPADAKRYEMETDAQARKNTAVADAEARRLAVISQAQADAESTRLTGHAERERRVLLAEAEAVEGARRGEAERARRAAVTEAVIAEGDAQAKWALAVGNAEAEAMRARADAFHHYGNAAVLDLLIKVLPDVVGRAAQPMEAIDSMTVISTDGATRLTRDVAENVAQGLQIGKDLTGIDLRELLAGLAGTSGPLPAPTVGTDDRGGRGGDVAGADEADGVGEAEPADGAAGRGPTDRRIDGDSPAAGSPAARAPRPRTERPSTRLPAQKRRKPQSEV
ncbi:SPFH domain-containing protein [Stackebrandtia albiflava]